MLDWQARIDGEPPPGWEPNRDGCWFPDWPYQEHLLPYFDVGDTPLDEYGVTTFEGSALHRLRASLQAARELFATMPESWSVSGASSNTAVTVTMRRKDVLWVIDRTLRMIEVALAAGGCIQFFGD